MKIAVCDDQKEQSNHIMTLIATVAPHCDTTPFNHIKDLYSAIKANTHFDVLLMDIEWEGQQKTGIDFANELHTLSPKTKIVFVTGYPNRYCQHIFLKNSNLQGFVAKPIDADILRKTLVNVQNLVMQEKSRKLLLKFGKSHICIDPYDIVYIESRGHTVTVYTTQDTHVCYEKLTNLEKQLSNKFICTHKSFLINMDKIKRMERECVILCTGVKVPVSKAKFAEVKDCYFRYASNNI